MALITDPDDLVAGTEVTINTSARTITLNIAGNLSTDGVTLQALYSFLKEEWKNDNALIPFPFPMIAITPEQFEFVSDWVPANDDTRKLIRTGGWAEVSSAGAVKREYLGVVTLGSIDGSDTAYYAFSSDSSRTAFTYSGRVNEAIQTFGNASHGNFNKKTDVLTLYIRVQGKTYGQITTTDIGVPNITYKVERFPLSEAADLKIVASDATIAADAPYTGMAITFYATPQSKAMGSSNYNFGVVVNANGGTAQQVYEFIQYSLRLNSDIDAGAGTVNGLLASGMAQFVGDRLDTLSVTNPAGGGSGVFIENLNTTSINNVQYIDNTGTYRTFPFVASGVINFSQTLVDDADAVYKLFFTSTPDGAFGTSNAIVVDDGDGDDIAGSVGGNSQIAFTFDYDGNSQGSRTPGTDAAVTIVAIGLSTAQYVSATATVTRSSSNIISLVAPLERNYAT
jgi:hypothetical protein